MSRWKRTTAAVLVLSAALAVPAAAAERKPARSFDLAAVATQAWQRLTAPLGALWAQTGGAVDKGRGGMDPNGTPLPPPPPTSSTTGTTGDGGGGMDPNGQP